MEDNNVNEVTPGKPVKKPLFWLTIRQITRIESAVLLIIGGNIDLIMGFAIWAIYGMSNPGDSTIEEKYKLIQTGGDIFLGGILLFGVNLTIGIFSILKKQWAIWIGFILSIGHCIGMYILLRYYVADDPISEFLLLVIRGWAVSVFLYLATILINGISKHTINQA